MRRSAKGVIAAAVNSEAIASILVVSGDSDVLAWAAGLGDMVVPLRQPEATPGLNAAISLGRQWALDSHADRLMSLFADLPLLDEGDVLQMASHPQRLLLGPDRQGLGTNALVLNLDDPGSLFRFAFGDASLSRHLREAQRLGLDYALHDSVGTRFDLDTPQDWSDFLETLSEIGIHGPLEWVGAR